MNKQMTASRPQPMVKFRTFKTALTGVEANGLAAIFREFQETNGAVSESVSRWMAKNLKKLRPVVDKTNALNKSIFEEYVEKDGEKSVFWDYNEANPKAIVNNNMLFSVEDGKPVPANLAGGYKAYVAGEGRLKEFEEKRKATDAEKHPVQIEQLNIELLANVNIPTQIDVVGLYDTLTFDADNTEEETKNEE